MKKLLQKRWCNIFKEKNNISKEKNNISKEKNNISKEETFSVQEWIPISKIVRGGIVRKDGIFVKVLQVTPINFELKSDFEQEAILECYKRFLKACSFDMQLLVQTQVTDISKHLQKLKRMREEENTLQEMAEDYMNFVQEITSSRKNVSRKFYLIIEGDHNVEENICKIKEGLGTCGNLVEECTEEEMIVMLKNCFNKRLRGLERKKV